MIQPSVVETDGDQVVVNEAEKARTILGREAESSDLVSLPPVAAVVEKTRETTTEPASPGHPYTTKTTSTTIRTSPVSPTSSIVPAASSPAPDVGKAKVP
jgi:hypothetical protein